MTAAAAWRVARGRARGRAGAWAFVLAAALWAPRPGAAQPVADDVPTSDVLLDDSADDQVAPAPRPADADQAEPAPPSQAAAHPVEGSADGADDDQDPGAWSWESALVPAVPSSEGLLDLAALRDMEDDLIDDLRVVGPPPELVEGPYEGLEPPVPMDLADGSPDGVWPFLSQPETPAGLDEAARATQQPPTEVATLPPEQMDLSGIRPLFGLDRLDYGPIQTYLHFYTTDGRSRMARLLARSGRYRDLIRSELARAGLPEELLYLVMIESGFDPTARSRAGAVGLWQLMAPTARGLGLTVTRRFDERLDPERSTEAAIGYLQQLHDRFGSWTLAMAGYNAGGGHVVGEVRRYNLNDFWRMDEYGAVWDETRRYVYRIIAAAIIGENPERFGFDAVVPESPVAYETVDVPGNARLSVLARLADTDVDTLLALNPALRVARTPDVESYPLHIPANALQQFLAAQEGVRIDPGDPGTLLRLRFGETLEDLAAVLGISARALREANGVERGEAVAYGSEVVVPLPAEVVEPLMAAWPGAPPDEADRPVVVTPPTHFDYPDRRRVFYEVHDGDELAAVATAFGVSVYDLAMWNDVDPDVVLQDGMTLQVFVPAGADLTGVRYLPETHVRALALGSAEFTAWDEAQEASQRARRHTYTVRPGDTLSGIAHRLGVGTADLMRWNDLDDPDRLRAGMELRVRQ